MVEQACEKVKPDRSRKRPVGAPTHVRSWPLRPSAQDLRRVEVRFFAGVRVYNAVLAEFIIRSRAVKADPRYARASAMPKDAKGRKALFDEVVKEHGFSESAAMSYASGLRQSWVREHVPAQEAQALAKRAFKAVSDWHYSKRATGGGKAGRPRFKSTRHADRGLSSMESKDKIGALRPAMNNAGELAGLRWGKGWIIPIVMPREGTSRRAREEQAEYARINELINADAVLYTRITKPVVRGRATWRMQIVMDGLPDQRHPVGTGRVGLDLGPSNVAVAVQPDGDGGEWASFVVPLAPSVADQSRELRRLQRRLDRQHRAGSPTCFNPDGTHKRRCEWGRYNKGSGVVSFPKSKAALRTAAKIADLHRRRAAARKTEHGRLANLILGVGAQISCEKLDYVAWQKQYPRSVRDRAPGMFVETLRRKAASAGGAGVYELNPYTTALSQTCLCGTRKKKSLSERTHRCGNCGLTMHRDQFSAYLTLAVNRDETGRDVLDLETANDLWTMHHPEVVPAGFLRYETDAASRPNTAPPKRRGRRPSIRAAARIKARRIRQSRSTQTDQTGLPTATPDLPVAA